MIKKNCHKLSKILSLVLISTAISRAAIANENEEYYFPTGVHEGGGVRGNSTGCAADAKNPVPITSQNSQDLTTSDSLELLFQVPDVIHASTLEVMLLDQNNQVVYQNEFDPGYQPGIVGVNVTDNSNSNALKIGSSYHWYLIQECDGIDTPNIVADGSLKRIKLEQELAEKLANASQLEKVKLYQSANIWHEAIANLAQLKCNNLVNSENNQQLMEIKNLNDILNLSSQSFDSYCSNNFALESNVMQ